MQGCCTESRMSSNKVCGTFKDFKKITENLNMDFFFKGCLFLFIFLAYMFYTCNI